MKKFFLILLSVVLAFGCLTTTAGCNIFSDSANLGNNKNTVPLKVFASKQELLSEKNYLFYDKVVNFDVQCNGEFTLSIVFSDAEPFHYKVNGKTLSSLSFGEISYFFNIIPHHNGFTIYFDEDFSVENLIKSIISSSAKEFILELPELSLEKFYFKLQVIDEVTNEVLIINFNFINNHAIVLDKNLIII